MISILENEQTHTLALLSDGEIYRTAPEQAKTLQTRLSEIEAEITQLLERWEALEARAG